MQVLVVDDDPEILSMLRRGLIYEGYAVDVAPGGKEALSMARDKTYDLVILDVMMPDPDGLEVSRRLRQAGSIPILMLTAKDSVADKVAGLDAGADDYLAKPFAFDELLARIRALMRRSHPREEDVLRFGELTLNIGTREVTRMGRRLELTTKEFELLELFLRNPRHVLTRDLIYERVWGYDFGGQSNVIEVYIRYLRAKMEAEGEPRLIHTVRGAGYALRE